jgi:cell division transport system permease protein
MVDRIEFLLSEAVTALRRNGLMTFAAITTAAVALFLLGGLGYVYYRVTLFAEEIPGKFEMRVFLKEDVSYDEVRATAADIRAIDGVATANWIPRDKAWALEREKNPEMTEGIENPYPEAFKVVLTDLRRTDAVAEQIRLLPHVDDDPAAVQYLAEEQRLIEEALKVVRLIGFSIGGLLFLTAGILIYNAIRLTVDSRRLEIRIMQLVGATRSTVQIPFLIEGAVQGAVGGTLATAIIYLSQWVVVTRFLQPHFPAFEAQPFPLWTVFGLLVLIGAFYGLLCSSIAVRAPLKFR